MWDECGKSCARASCPIAEPAGQLLTEPRPASRHLTWLGTRLLHRTSGEAQHPRSALFDHIFRNERVTGQIPSAPPNPLVRAVFHRWVIKSGKDDELAGRPTASRVHRSALTGQQFQSPDAEPYYVLFDDFTHVKFYPSSLRGSHPPRSKLQIASLTRVLLVLDLTGGHISRPVASTALAIEVLSDLI